MAQRTRRIVGGLAGAAIAALCVTSCVDNDGSLVIIGIMSPPTATGGTCAYTANIIGPFLSYGTMDVAFADQYIPTLLIGNQMNPQGNQSLDRVETDNVILQGAIVRVTDASGAQLDDYTVPGDGFVPPSSGGTAGIASFATTLVSPTASSIVVNDLQNAYGSTKRLISYVKIFGTTTGGTHIESGEVAFPIDACLGCLVTFPDGSDDEAQPANLQPNCLASSSAGGSAITQPCLTGQDQYVDCRLCQGNPACDPKR